MFGGDYSPCRVHRVCLSVVVWVLLLGRAARAEDAPPPPSTAPPVLTPAASAIKDEVKALESRINDEQIRVDTALKAKDLQEAKNSQERQAAAQQQLNAVASLAKADPALSPLTSTTQGVTQKKTDDSKNKVEKATSTSGCDGTSSVCLFGGALVGSYSLTSGWGDRKGQTSHHMISLLVPAGGVRWALLSQLSIDLSLYTSIISPELQVNPIGTAGTGCSKTQSQFNDLLPCEGNAVLRPYAALLLGGTVGTGNSSLGIITIGVTGGVARTSQDASAFWFVGLMIGTAGVYSTVSLQKAHS